MRKRQWKCPECGETERREPHRTLSDHMEVTHGKLWDESQNRFMKRGFDMGECGCSSGHWEHKIIDHEGWAWLFRVYPSCQDCSSPVGFDFFRVHPKDWHIWDVEHVPEIKTDENGTFFIPIIDPAIVRKLMEKSMIGYEPEDGPLDQIDAETLSEEAFPDLSDAYWETRRANN